MKVLVCLAFARLGIGSVARVQDPEWRQMQFSDILSWPSVSQLMQVL
ncbi:hypothetical protein JI435_420020 [Parastagonospora nodorum SN15]|uniref:Uncharacterized protein n=1 Tax=Phaeosphaeria nodorum (strain SN15 / ATCC MYA-4574 / FGSC 10173) TaxID=321614 RepID=A0A7U2I844_PHANO|nr:hypothetical protein JI435_420020 [Parastagonospora nodorum SN15]